MWVSNQTLYNVCFVDVLNKINNVAYVNDEDGEYENEDVDDEDDNPDDNDIVFKKNLTTTNDI